MAQAVEAGLSRAVFEDCIDRDEIDVHVKSEGAASAALIPTGTPAFVIGRRRPDGRMEVMSTVAGLRSIEEFSEEIDWVLTGQSRMRWLFGSGVVAAVAFALLILSSAPGKLRLYGSDILAARVRPSEATIGDADRGNG